MYPPGRHIAPESFPFLIDCAVAGIETACGLGRDRRMQEEHRLAHLQSEALHCILDAAARIDAAEREAFLRQTLERIRVLIKELDSVRGNKTVPAASIPRYRNMLDELAVKVAFLQEEEAIKPAGRSFKTSPLPHRIQLVCSGAFIGAMLRLMSDNRIIMAPSASQLARWTSESFSTTKQQELNANHLRNAITTPRFEVLEQLLQQLKEWVGYVERLMEVMSR